MFLDQALAQVMNDKIDGLESRSMKVANRD